jgi:dephospho-CoA kinase
MLRVALTGGIATGKSYVLAALRQRGVMTIDADEIVHQQLLAGTPTNAAVAREFGRSVIKPNGDVDRALLGQQVFADADARLRLEAIVHPVVRHTIQRWFETLEVPLGVASIPLLFETGREKDFDFVVVTACPEAQQIERVVQRGLSEEDAELRIAAQVPTDLKIKWADFVISTSGTMPETDAQVERLIQELSHA